jgi:hypothetical protein
MLANLILGGSQKSGTSSLYEYLAQHPDIAVSKPKEPTFFSLEKNLDKLPEYDKVFGYTPKPHRDYTYFMEASTAYLNEEYVPERISAVLGENVKFIFIVKEPVERTISAFWHTYKRFDELRNIQNALCFFKQ